MKKKYQLDNENPFKIRVFNDEPDGIHIELVSDEGDEIVADLVLDQTARNRVRQLLSLGLGPLVTFTFEEDH